MNMIFSILGLTGGVLCAIGDILFDLKGKGNKKLGTSRNIDSNCFSGLVLRDCENTVVVLQRGDEKRKTVKETGE